MLEYRLGDSIRALKNLTYNEPFFRGHFPGRPVMPGVMIIEALAQTADILRFSTASLCTDAGVYKEPTHDQIEARHTKVGRIHALTYSPTTQIPPKPPLTPEPLYTTVRLWII